MGQTFLAKPGDKFKLKLKLEDHVTDKYVQCNVLKLPSLAPITGSPFGVPHVGNGLHVLLDSQLVFPDDNATVELVADFTVFDDAGFTQVSSEYGGDADVYQNTFAVGAGSGASSLNAPSGAEIVMELDEEVLDLDVEPQFPPEELDIVIEEEPETTLVIDGHEPIDLETEPEDLEIVIEEGSP